MTTLRQQLEQRIKDKDKEENSTKHLFRNVEGAGSLKELKEKRHTPNCCYVFRVGVGAGDNKYGIKAVEQQTLETYAFAIVVKNNRSRKGLDSSDVAEELSAEVSKWVLGWQPEIGGGVFTYAGGSLASMKDGFYIWQELYQIRGERVKQN